MCAKRVPSILRQQALANTVPVVTLPPYVKDQLEKQKQKAKLKLLQVAKLKPIGGNKAFPLITAQNSDFNFYLGQRYPKHCRIPLISDHWMKKNTSGQKFTILKRSENPSLPVVFNREGIDDRYQFSQFGLNKEIVEALKTQGIIHPTPPQTKAVPEILEDKNVLFVAQSGSGKTIAYVAPLLHSISNLKEKFWGQANSPLAVVIVPGKELAEQIAHQAYVVGEPCGIDVRVVVPGGTEYEHLVPKNNTNVDLLVGTFGILAKLFRRKVFRMRNIHHVVLDEADTLLDDSFQYSVLPFLQYLMAFNDEETRDRMTLKVQLILVSCIWPSDFEQILCDLMPVEEVKKIISPQTHHLMPHVTHKFERVRDSVRSGVLLEHVKADDSKKIPVMVFANQSPACDWMSDFFEQNNIPNAKFHGGMPIEERTAAFNAFRDGLVNVLCCTDLASRGLDVQWVRHIINFDFPHNMSDYIHRAGRIGRVGSNHGHITNIVNSVPGAAIVQQIEMAVRRSTGLPYVESNIKRKINKLKHKSQYQT